MKEEEDADEESDIEGPAVGPLQPIEDETTEPEQEKEVVTEHSTVKRNRDRPKYLKDYV